MSFLSDFSVDPIFEDSTVYVLDSKLDATFPVPPRTPPCCLRRAPRWRPRGPPPIICTLAMCPRPAASSRCAMRRERYQCPAQIRSCNRNTTDYTSNFGVNPTVHLGTQCADVQQWRAGNHPPRFGVSGADEPKPLSRIHLRVDELVFQRCLRPAGTSSAKPAHLPKAIFLSIADRGSRLPRRGAMGQNGPGHRMG